MPQSSQNNKLIPEIHRILQETLQKQEILESQIQKIFEKLDTLTNNVTNFTSNTHREQDIQELNSASLVEYFETNYGHMREIGHSFIKDKGYRERKNNLRMWKSSLNNRKLTFFNTIKNREKAKIYRDFLTTDPVFIPRKLREKHTPHDTEEQKNIKAELEIAKLNTEIKLLENKSTISSNKYLEIDEGMRENIRNMCSEDTHVFLRELWDSDCKEQEEKSIQILQRKIDWLIKLPELDEETTTSHTGQHFSYSNNNNNRPRGPNQRKNIGNKNGESKFTYFRPNKSYQQKQPYTTGNYTRKYLPRRNNQFLANRRTTVYANHHNNNRNYNKNYGNPRYYDNSHRGGRNNYNNNNYNKNMNYNNNNNNNSNVHNHPNNPNNNNNHNNWNTPDTNQQVNNENTRFLGNKTRVGDLT